MSGKERSREDGHGGGSHGGGHGGGGHGGGGHDEEHEGAPEWLISFADNVMLMMGFFVILFALNITADGRKPGGTGEETDPGQQGWEERVLDFAIGIRKAFHNPVELDSDSPADAALVRRLEQRMQRGGAATDGVNGQDERVQSVRPDNYFDQGTSVSFAGSSTTLTPEAKRSIDALAAKLRGQTTVVELRGHASVQESFQKPEEALTLAYQRALAVAQRLAADGIDWDRMRLVAAGDTERISRHPRNAAEDTVNARVEIIATDLVTHDDADRQVAAPTTGPE